MRRPWWLRSSEADDEDGELGTPGPVLDPEGEPVLGPGGQPLEKVLVVTRRDTMGDVAEAAWMDPRIAWQWDESVWH